MNQKGLVWGRRGKQRPSRTVSDSLAACCHEVRTSSYCTKPAHTLRRSTGLAAFFGALRPLPSRVSCCAWACCELMARHGFLTIAYHSCPCVRCREGTCDPQPYRNRASQAHHAQWLLRRSHCAKSDVVDQLSSRFLGRFSRSAFSKAFDRLIRPSAGA